MAAIPSLILDVLVMSLHRPSPSSIALIVPVILNVIEPFRYYARSVSFQDKHIPVDPQVRSQILEFP